MYILIRYLILTIFVAIAIGSQLNAQESYSIEDTALTQEEIDWIREHPVLKSTNDMSFAPIDFVRGGQPTGFSIDYLNLVASKVGLEIEYVNGYEWEELLQMLRDKQIDVTHSTRSTPVREEYIEFTNVYLNMAIVNFGRLDAEEINDISDLESLKVGVILESAISNLIREQYPDLEYVEFETTPEVLEAVSAGTIDVFPGMLPVGNYVLSTNFIPGVKVIGGNVFPELEDSNPIRLGVRKDWPILVGILEKGMTMVTEAEFRQISDRWQAEYRAGNGLGLTQQELDWLAENPVVRTSVDPTVAPLEFIDVNNRISGIAGDFLADIEQKLNIRFEWVGNNNWEEGIAKIRSEEADIVSTIIPTPERRRFLSFTDPVMTVSNMIFARTNSPFFGNMEGLRGYKLAQIAGSAVSTFVRQDYPDIEILEVGSISEGFQSVSDGEADAFVSDIPVSSYRVVADGFDDIVIVGETEYDVDFAIGVRNKLPLLASALNKAVRSITPIQRSQVMQKWYSIDVERGTDYTLLWQIGGGFLALLTILLVWAISLRREIARREVIANELVALREEAEIAKIEAEAAKRQAEIALQEAEAANAAKSSFLANMSHEIRTPLNAIIGFSGAMTSGIFGEINPPRYREYVEDIEKSGEHLATVVNDILALSKIEAGKWQLEKTEFLINVCLADSIRMIKDLALEKELNLSVSDPQGLSGLTLYGDLSALKRVIINLLSNAVKFTERRGEIVCSYELTCDGGIKIVIKDTGVGIPPDRIDKVLNPFEQAKNEYDLNEEGTGLGLSIVQKLVELHEGKFKLTSELGKGTSAIIILPPENVVQPPAKRLSS